MMPSTLLKHLSTVFGVDIASIDPLEQLRNVMAWYPNKTLYERTSNLSGKRIISVYRPDAPCPVYSHDEWYADTWESPALAYDPQQTLLEQFSTLQQKAPVVGLLSSMQENAEYCQDAEGLKDCYLVFDGLQCRDVYYASRILNSRDCVDVYWIMDSELLYDCVYMFNCYRSRYCHNCYSVSDSAFLFNCRNVQNCFFSSNLQNAQYCIFNKQHSKEEYEQFIAGIPWEDYETMLHWKNRFRRELVATTPRPPAFLQLCEDVSGNYLKQVAFAEKAFESFELRDAYNVFQCGKGRDVVGSYMCIDRVERCFQSVATGIEIYDVRNCAFVWHSSFMEYCYLCQHCQHCFGCIGLRNKRYHILNKPYAKEAYEETVSRIRESMRHEGTYDQFFPLSMSPFPYEDTIASDLFRDAAEEPIVEREETVSRTNQQRQTNELEYVCPLSGKRSRYTPQERGYYERHKIPRPRIHPSLRYRSRMEMMDTSFIPREVTVEQGKKVDVYYSHPSEKNIVSFEQYADMMK